MMLNRATSSSTLFRGLRHRHVLACNQSRQHISVHRPLFHMSLEVEAIYQKGAQHQPEILEIHFDARLWSGRLGNDIEAPNPRTSAHLQSIRRH